jgi:hypothetical protein
MWPTFYMPLLTILKILLQSSCPFTSLGNIFSLFSSSMAPKFIIFSSSQIYHMFDTLLLLSHGRVLYSGPGGFTPVERMAAQTRDSKPKPYTQGYNIADYLLEVASEAPVGMFRNGDLPNSGNGIGHAAGAGDAEKGGVGQQQKVVAVQGRKWWWPFAETHYAATFFTQLQVLSGREWKILRR